MKKIVILITMLTIIVGISMASITGLPNDQEPIKEKDGKLQVQWKFTPEVETRYGYNFDSMASGLKGSINADISLMFLDKDVEFTGEEAASGKGVWGKIKVTDLEVKVDISDKPNDYNSGITIKHMESSTATKATETTVNSTGLNINWESITAWVYFGPSFYIKMGDINHYEIRYVETIRDTDISVIGDSIIPPFYTGSYMGRRDTFARFNVKTTNDNGEANGDPIYLRKVTDQEYISNTGLGSDNLNGFAVGIAIPDKITVELGAQTKFHYEERVQGNYNPFNLSLLLETKLSKDFSFNFKANATSGNKARDGGEANIDYGVAGVTSDSNPLVLGGSVAYTMPMGNMNFVPTLAGEVMLEERRKINTSSKLVESVKANNLLVAGFDPQTKLNWKNGYIMTIPAEVALGFTLNWKSLGRSADEGGHLAMSSQDIKVTDGVSLVGVFGEQPYEPIPEIPTMYTGVQLSVWESDADGKTGIAPNLKAGLITNLNYAFGGTYDVKDLASGSSLSYSKYEFTNSPRLDWGIGTEMSYKMAEGVVTPYFGVIFKALDIIGETETIKYEGTSEPLKATGSDGAIVGEVESKVEDRYASRSDLRMKIGVDFKLAKNVTLNTEWKSGDLLYSQSSYKTDDFNKGYNDYDYFEIQDKAKSRVPSFGSTAQTGVISVGLKVAF